MKKGLLIIILAPSGGGKGTILQKIFANNSNIKSSVSATTRKPRPGEVEGIHYHFTTREEFEELIKTGGMLEYAEYCGNYYGTKREPVEEWTNAGFDVILEIEVQGGLQVKKMMPDAVSIFIVPPSMKVLEDRLRRRGTETNDVIEGRLKVAVTEISQANEFDYIVVNDHLDDAVDDVEAIIRAEKLRYSRNDRLIEGVLKDA